MAPRRCPHRFVGPPQWVLPYICGVQRAAQAPTCGTKSTQGEGKDAIGQTIGVHELDHLTLTEIEAGWRLRPAWEISLIMGEGQQVVLAPSVHSGHREDL